jgi:hypothetical protein
MVEKGVRAPSFAVILLLPFHAMILWGNKRFQEGLDKADECLRKAPQFRGQKFIERSRSSALVDWATPDLCSMCQPQEAPDPIWRNW